MKSGLADIKTNSLFTGSSSNGHSATASTGHLSLVTQYGMWQTGGQTDGRTGGQDCYMNIALWIYDSTRIRDEKLIILNRCKEMTVIRTT